MQQAVLLARVCRKVQLRLADLETRLACRQLMAVVVVVVEKIVVVVAERLLTRARLADGRRVIGGNRRCVQVG